mmetsp:Transcript_1870/g.3885  ORF Transcript_1870/g.3885 Transcript_1870/m.3885 type:complete len:256 (-) Transcript_1870:18-785(-)
MQGCSRSQPNLKNGLRAFKNTACGKSNQTYDLLPHSCALGWVRRASFISIGIRLSHPFRSMICMRSSTSPGLAGSLSVVRMACSCCEVMVPDLPVSKCWKAFFRKAFSSSAAFFSTSTASSSAFLFAAAARSAAKCAATAASSAFFFANAYSSATLFSAVAKAPASAAAFFAAEAASSALFRTAAACFCAGVTSGTKRGSAPPEEGRRVGIFETLGWREASVTRGGSFTAEANARCSMPAHGFGPKLCALDQNGA